MAASADGSHREPVDLGGLRLLDPAAPSDDTPDVGELQPDTRPVPGPIGAVRGRVRRLKRSEEWRQEHSPAHELRNTLILCAVFLPAFWAIAVVWDVYMVALVYTVPLLGHVAWLLVRRTGAPEWSASEAYVPRWRRWRRAQRSDGPPAG